MNFRKLLVSISITAACVLTASLTALAIEVPQFLTYNGRLTDSSDTALSGTYSMVFTLYDAATAGNTIWTETNSVTVDEGFFAVTLGTNTSLSNVAFDEQYYLGINVAGDGEMTPRTRINPVAYAFNSDIAYGVYQSSDAPTGSAGKLYYDTDDDELYYYDGNTSSWTAISGGGGGGGSTDDLDDAYNNIGAAAAKINIDAGQSQTGGLEFESSISDNIIFDLQSTGDIAFQDAGTAFLTLNDDDSIDYATDLVTTDAVQLTGNSLTSSDLLQLSATSLTSGDALQITTNGTLTGYAINVVSGDVFFGGEIQSGGSIIFEGSTADANETTLAVADPDGDRTITLPNASGTVILSGHTFTGDVTATLDTDGSTALTIASNSVALGTDTTGNYLATLADAGNSFFTVANSGSESAAVTLDLANDSINFAQLADSLTLDAETTIAAGSALNLLIGNNVTLTTTGTGTITANDVAANSVALGTDTTGNYLATLADAGNSFFTVANSGSESAAVTLDLANDSINFAQLADSLTIDTAAIASGTLTFNDNAVLAIGTGNDLQISHNATNTTLTSATGNLIIDNTNATGATQFKLGTDDSDTKLAVVNSSDTEVFSLNAAGDAIFTTTPTGTTGANLVFYSQKATPDPFDAQGQVTFRGIDSDSNDQDYAQLKGTVISNTSDAEWGALFFSTATAGTLAERLVMFYDPDGNAVTIAAQTSNANLSFSVDGSSADILFTPGSSGNVGISTSAPDKALEINSSNGNNLRLTYNDSDGSATNYVDLLTTSSGDLAIAPSGGDTNITGNLAATLRIDTAAHANNVGLNIPTNAGAPSGVTGTAEGDIVWDSTNDALYVYDGSSFAAVGGGSDADTFDTLDSTQFLRSDTSDAFTSGSITFNDSTSLIIGTGSDLTITHNTTNSLITSTTGNLIIDNTNATGATQVQLGTDTSATRFAVLNDTGDNIFYIDGAGSTRLNSTSAGAAGAEIVFYQDSASPAQYDAPGLIRFRGKNSADEDVDYAEIGGATLSVTDGSELGAIYMSLYGGGSSATALAFGYDGTDIEMTTFINDKNLKLTSLGTGDILLNSAANVGVGTSAPDKALEINSSNGNNLRLTYNDSDGSATNYVDLVTTSGGDLSLQPSGGDTQIKFTDAGATGPNLILHHDSSSPATDTDVLGQLVFRGNDPDNTSNALDYITFTARLGQNEGGAEHGELRIGSATETGSATDFLGIQRDSAMGLASIETLVNNEGLALITAGTGDIILAPGNAVGIGDLDPAALFTVGDGDLFQVDGSGNVTLNADSTSLTIGAGSDFSITHNGTNTIMTSATGNLVIDNTSATGATQIQLGTDTSATKLAVLNNTGTELFSIDGAGTNTITATNDGANGATLKLYQNSASPDGFDKPGIVQFIGKNLADEDVTYGEIGALITNNADGAESGGVYFGITSSGTVFTPFVIGYDESQVDMIGLIEDKHMVFSTQGTGDISFSPGGDTIIGGGVIIGTDSADNKIDDSSNGSASTTLYIGNETIDTTASDRRLKTNILDSEISGLEIVNKLRIRDFDWLPGNPRAERGRMTGLIAQEVVEYLPQVVKVPDDPDSIWSVEYHHIVPYLAKAIQEQQAEIVALQGAGSNASSQSLEVIRKPNFDGDSVGQAKILQGTNKVTVQFAESYAYMPIITVTPIGLLYSDYVLDNITPNGFEIYLTNSADRDYTFNWHAFASSEARLYVSDGTIQNVTITVDSPSNSSNNTQSSGGSETTDQEESESTEETEEAPDEETVTEEPATEEEPEDTTEEQTETEEPATVEETEPEQEESPAEEAEQPEEQAEDPISEEPTPEPTPAEEQVQE